MEEEFVVHISDLHIKDSTSPACVRLKQIAPALSSLREHAVSDVLILVSGDIAFSGSAKEYSDALDYFDVLCSELKSNGFRRVTVYSVPGNHDCDFSAIDDGLHSAVLNSIDDAQPTSAGVLNTLLSVQKDFFAFRDAVCEGTNLVGGVVHSADYTIHGRSVQLLLINTAWTSKLKEVPGTLRMTESALPEMESVAELCIAVLHHPLNWFAPGDSLRLSEWLDRHADIALWGHEHRIDDFEQSRKQLGSSVHHYLAMPIEDPRSKCGFRVMKFSSDASELDLFEFDWQGNSYTLANSHKETRKPNPARAIGTIRFSKAFREDVDDAGAAFTHARVNRPVKFSDIYVAPEFRRFESDRTDVSRIDATTGIDALLDDVFLDGVTVLYGPEQGGKTSVAKVVCQDAKHRGITPIYLDAQLLKSINQGEITAWINKGFDYQYEPDCIERVRLTSSQKRLLILDNIDLIPGPSIGLSVVLERAKPIADKLLCLTSQNPAIALLTADNSKSETVVFKGAHWFELLPLGHKRRHDLIRKWASLGRDVQSESEEIEAEVRQIKQLLDRVLGKAFLPKYPIFLLLLLQQLEGFRADRTVVANGSHGFLFENLINKALDANVRSQPIDTVHEFLAKLAFDLWGRVIPEVSTGKIESIVASFRREKLVEIDERALLTDLQQARVLKVSGDLLSFRYPYLYYYYLARWLIANRKTEPADIVMRELLRLIHTERSSNVLMFVCHLRGEDWVLENLLPLARSLFESAQPCCLIDRAALARRFDDLKEREVLLQGNVVDVSEHHNRGRDYADGATREIEGTHQDAEDALKFNTALRVIQTLGQVIKSRAGHIDGKIKVEVASAAIGVSRRLMSVMYELLNESAGDVVQLASDALEEKLRLNKEEAVALANRVMGVIVQGVAKTLVGRTADAIASTELLPLISALEEKQDLDHDDRLFLLAARLVADKVYPKEQVEDFIHKTKPSDILARSVLANSVARRFYLQPPAYQIKSSACKLLGIEVRQLPPSTVQNSTRRT